MKNKLKSIIMALILSNICIAVNESTLPKDQLALTIIIDTSWSCERYISDFASLSRQAISSSLGPGSYIEVLSAHPGNPRIRIAQTIKSIPGEISGITAILKTINSGFLTNATISSALDMTFKRLERISLQNQYGNVAVIIFSDGRLSDSDARRIVEFSEQFQKKGWSLYITGIKDTNKHILVAANQNKLQWSFISEANPVLWLQKPQKKPEPDEQRQIPSETEPYETPKESQEPLEQDNLSEKAPTITKSVEQENIKSPGYKISASVKSEVSVSPSSTETADVSSEVPEKSFAENPEEPVPSAIEQPVVDTQKAKPKFWQRVWSKLKKISSRTFLLIFMPVAVLAIVLGFIIFKGIREARKWKANMNSKLKNSQQNDNGVLVAKLNGQSYRLGKLDNFRSIHVGSDTNNTIRISNKSVEGRHLEIYKKDDQLMLRNLAESPVIANNTEVKSGQRHQLVVPSIIQLNDRIKLNLELDRPKVSSTENRSNKNEPDRG